MTETMSSETTRALLTDFLRAWSTGDAEAIGANLTPDVVLTPPPSIGRPAVGREAVASILSGAAAAKFLQPGTTERRIETIIVDGAAAAVMLSLEAQLIAGGTYTNTYCWIFECRNGAITSATEFTDTNHAIRTFTAKR